MSDAGGDSVLLALLVRGPLGTAPLLEAEGVPPTELEALAAAGEVVEEASPSGPRWALTQAGEERARGALGRLRAATGPAVESRFQAFAELNGLVKAQITAWQMRDGPEGMRPNDHGDLRYDRRVLSGLAEQVAAARRWLSGLGHPRFERYGARLDAAIARVRAGETHLVSGLDADSIHSIWWQLHAELLALLERERGAGDA